MGLGQAVSRSTLADANENRDWRIYAEFASRLIEQARKLYASDDFGVELANTVYALDATTIDLCLSVFPWASFRQTKAAIKLHTLLDLRGSIPAFIHISDGKLDDDKLLACLVARRRTLPDARGYDPLRAEERRARQPSSAQPGWRGTGLFYTMV